MPNWFDSMQQTFEYYIVDPGTWMDTKRLTNVKSCSITRDSTVETLGSATIDIEKAIGENYIRTYLVTIQNGITEKTPLGTVLVQTPNTSFDGKVSSVSMDAYTPLIELKENKPPLGYFLLKEENIMDCAYRLTRDHARAPVTRTSNEKNLYSDFVAQTDDTWLSFLTDLLANAKYSFSLDEMGRIEYMPKQDIASLQPVVEFNDSNSSILYPEITLNRDLYGVPNVVEVLYSKNNEAYYARVVNDDPNSPTSTVARGREIVYRVSDPDMIGNPTNNQIQEYAEQLLKEQSSVECTVSYSHGYYPVRVGDCVRLNYAKAGITDIKAKIISQTIKCEPGCPVTEKAVFTTKLWR